MAFTLIGGTAIGTVLILLFLPALYVAWFRIKPAPEASHAEVAPSAKSTDWVPGSEELFEIP